MSVIKSEEAVAKIIQDKIEHYFKMGIDPEYCLEIAKEILNEEE